MKSKLEELVGDLENIIRKKRDSAFYPRTFSIDEIESVLVHHTEEQEQKATEQLAVLADRMGFWKTKFTSEKDAELKEYWSCEIERTSFNIQIARQRHETFTAPTYAACEQLDRTWLEEQEDKK